MKYLITYKKFNESITISNSDNYTKYNIGNSYADIEKKDESWHICMIESKNKGDGTLLVNKIIEDAKKVGVKKITLTTTEHSGWGFFDKLGFVDDGTSNDIEFGMVKYLNESVDTSSLILKTPTIENLKECAMLMNDYLVSLNIDFGGVDGVFQFIESVTNLDISYVGYINDEFVGCLLFGNRQLSLDVRFKQFIGLEGVLMYIKPEYRGTNVDKKFIDVENKIKCDYIWCEVLEGLKTHSYWKRKGFKTLKDGEVSIYYKFLNSEKEKIFNNAPILKFQSQTTSYNCGTTVASMIIEYKKGIKVNSLDLFKKYCNLNYGTTTYNMMNILKNYDIPTTHLTKKDIDVNCDDNYILCLISLPQSNIPHWIIISSYFEDEYEIYDPAGGVYNIDKKDLNEMLVIKDWNGVPAKEIKKIAGEYQIIAIEK